MDYEIVQFVRRGRKYVYARDPQTKHFLFRLSVVFRVSFAINDVPHHAASESKYSDFLYQAFSAYPDVLRDNYELLKSDFIRNVEEYLGYPESEWWFDYTFGEEDITELDFDDVDENMLESFLFQVERQGKIVYQVSGGLEGIVEYD